MANLTTALSTGDPATVLPDSTWWHSYGALVGVLVGGLLTYGLGRLARKQDQPCKRIQCLASYCDDLFAPSVGAIGTPLVLSSGGSVLASPAIVLYRIACVGNATCTNVEILIQIEAPARAFNISADSEKKLLMDRVKQSEGAENTVRFSISYLDPGESLDISMLLSPGETAHETKIEVASEGCGVIREPMEADCNLRFGKSRRSAAQNTGQLF